MYPLRHALKILMTQAENVAYDKIICGRLVGQSGPIDKDIQCGAKKSFS